jgi:hypothetical protein
MYYGMKNNDILSPHPHHSPTYRMVVIQRYRLKIIKEKA